MYEKVKTNFKKDREIKDGMIPDFGEFRLPNILTTFLTF